MSESDITFAPPSAGPDTASGSNNSGDVQTSTVAHPAAPATTNGQGEAAADSDDGTLTTRVVRRKSRSPSSASRAGAQSPRDASSRSIRSASSGSRRSGCTPRGATGVSENDLQNPPCPGWTPRGPTDNTAIYVPACTPRGATDTDNVSASKGIGEGHALSEIHPGMRNCRGEVSTVLEMRPLLQGSPHTVMGSPPTVHAFSTLLFLLCPLLFLRPSIPPHI